MLAGISEHLDGAGLLQQLIRPKTYPGDGPAGPSPVLCYISGTLGTVPNVTAAWGIRDCPQCTTPFPYAISLPASNLRLVPRSPSPGPQSKTSRQIRNNQDHAHAAKCLMPSMQAAQRLKRYSTKQPRLWQYQIWYSVFFTSGRKAHIRHRMEIARKLKRK